MNFSEVATPPKESSFRPDIQGLRAIAVLSVIGIHYFSWPVGGFLGVDIFFVISGFLITGHLIREREKTGSISALDFYKRRIRRIVPVAALVIVVTVGLTMIAYRSGRGSVILDGIASLFFVSNWRFAAIDADSTRQTSPLHHYWSLGVEEQFYIAWPWLFILVLVVGAARFAWSRRQAATAISVLVLVIVVLSFGFAVWETATSPVVAYVSTLSRAWEFGIGAILATATGALVRIPALVRALLCWVGLVALLAVIVFIPAGLPTPGPWAAPAVFATAMIIAGGTLGSTLVPLTNPVARYIGDISYSLYLWHFPVIVLMRSALAELGVALYPIALALTLGLSIASYHIVENPIRRSSWLHPKNKKSPAESGSSALP